MKFFSAHLFLFFLLSFNFFAQSPAAEQILDNAICNFDQENFQIQVDYKLYKGKEGGKVYESYSGLIAKQGNQFYQKIGPMEMLQHPKINIKLNSDDKEMLVASTSFKKDNGGAFIETVFSQFREFKNDFKIELIKEDKSTYHLLLTPKQSYSQNYKFYILINKKDNLPVKQIFLTPTPIDFSRYDQSLADNRNDYARIEISYNNYKNSVENDFFVLDRYVVEKDTSFVPVNKYAGYKLYNIN